MKKQYIFSRPTIFDEAIITSLKKYGENNCIAKIFTKNYGRITVFSYKKQSKLLCSPSIANIGIKIKNNSNIWTLSQVDIYAKSLNLANSLKSYGYSCYIAELIEVFFAEQDKQEDAFLIFKNALNLIASGNNKPILLRSLELKLLKICGYLPDLSNLNSFAQKILTHDLDNLDLLANNIDNNMLLEVGRIFAHQLRCLVDKPLKSVKFINHLKY